MGLFSKIFKKKAGGTAVGNFFRGVGSSLTGGLIGTGKNMIPANGVTSQPVQGVSYSVANPDGSFSTADGKYTYVPEYLNIGGKAVSTGANAGKVFDLGSFNTLLQGLSKTVNTVATGGVPAAVKTGISGVIAPYVEEAGETATAGALKKYWWVLAIPCVLMIALLFKKRK